MFYLRQMDYLLKSVKVPKYYISDCGPLVIHKKNRYFRPGTTGLNFFHTCLMLVYIIINLESTLLETYSFDLTLHFFRKLKG